MVLILRKNGELIYYLSVAYVLCRLASTEELLKSCQRLYPFYHILAWNVGSNIQLLLLSSSLKNGKTACAWSVEGEYYLWICYWAQFWVRIIFDGELLRVFSQPTLCQRKQKICETKIPLCVTNPSQYRSIQYPNSKTRLKRTYRRGQLTWDP